MSALKLAILAAVIACWAGAPILAQPGPASANGRSWTSQGETVWIDEPNGRLKTRVYRSARLSPSPVLILVVHGDIPRPPPDYQYVFAQIAAGASENVVAAGVLRPGYADSQGDRSSGDMGYAVGDNYTAEVVDALDMAVSTLKARYHAGAVILVGHSGGAAIVADLLGRHPNSANGAVLVACGCDPSGFMARWIATHPFFPRHIPNRSLLPLQLAPQVSRQTRVRMVVGSLDDVAGLEPTQAYARALTDNGVDAKLVVAPGLGHNILLSAPVFQALSELIDRQGGSMSPPRLAPGPAHP